MIRRSMLIEAVFLSLAACAPGTWMQLRTEVGSRSNTEEVIRVTSAPGELRAIRIEVSHGGGVIRDITVRYASGRTYSVQHLAVEWTSPLVVYIPRGDVVEITMVYSGDVLIAPDVGRFWATIEISGSR
ncbi:MAG TPA: hypothetical protein VFZ51_08260 [Woeseiaceae bacterium]